MTDGVHDMVAREQMTPSARKIRDTYACKPGAPLFQREFGFYSLDEWKQQGMPQDVSREQLFGFDPAGKFNIGGVGWTEAAFVPEFEVKILEDRGEHELVQDQAGRKVLYFKGRRSGFMPTFEDSPVHDQKSWEENCKWRLAPDSPEREERLQRVLPEAVKAAREGQIITQRAIGGYMFLRSLMGPERLLYAFIESPELIHDCMKTWFHLMDSVFAKHQQQVTLDELFLSEDICYNHGLLISPNMMKEFLLPYYQELIANIKKRQLDKNRHLYVQIDTDGNAVPAIPIYQEIGMDAMSPFEVASGCDVVEIGKQFPGLVISGGIDKRILAKSIEDIDEMVERILPVMKARGGYVPTCDHGVPAEVPYENYLHYRKRCLELGA